MDKSRRINCHDKEDSTFEINNETLINGTSTGENYKYELIKNNRPYYKLQDIQLRRINYEHFKGIAKPLETSSKFSLIILDNAEFHYTDSREIQDNTVRNKIIKYIDEVEKEWKNLKGIISYIISTVIITIITTIIIIVITTRQIGNTEKRVNLIEGFLPTSIQVNMMQARKGNYQAAGFRRQSSCSVDSAQQRTNVVIDRILNG